MDSERRELRGKVKELQGALQAAREREETARRAEEAAAAELRDAGAQLRDEMEASSAANRRLVQLQEALVTANAELSVMRLTFQKHSAQLTEAKESLSGVSAEKNELLTKSNQASWRHVIIATVSIDCGRSHVQVTQKLMERLETLQASLKTNDTLLEAARQKADHLAQEKHNLEAALAAANTQVASLLEKQEESAKGAAGAKKPLVEPPRGTAVTIAFSDIDGGCVLMEMHPEAYKLAQAQYFKVLREKLAAVEGYEVRAEDDTLMAAFETPSQALWWCALSQEALLVQDWSQLLLQSKYTREERSAEGMMMFRGFRARMGAYCGPVHCQVDRESGRADYFGSTVNKAARLTSYAHGGQVLVPRPLWESVRDEASSMVPTDLGDHALKGDQPEPVVQLLPLSLKDRAFAELKSDGSDATQLLRSKGEVSTLASIGELVIEMKALERAVPEIQALEDAVRALAQRAPAEQATAAQAEVAKLRRKVLDMSQSLSQLKRSRTDLHKKLSDRGSRASSTRP
eukprot:m51a1_g13473 putative adenylate cyclase (518) ;mRNA; r:14-2195